MTKSEFGRARTTLRVRAGRSADIQSWIMRGLTDRAVAIPTEDFATSAWRRQRNSRMSVFSGVTP